LNQLERFVSRGLSLGPCLVGRNLNVQVIRGFATLSALALISGPDTYDQINNPEGTQRQLESKHSRDAVKYAISANEQHPDIDPRSFPEIILNARNPEVLEWLAKPQSSKGAPMSSDSLADLRDTSLVHIAVNLKALKQPIDPYSPEISRIDGNHRLSEANRLLEREEHDFDDFPTVPFALYLGLTKKQETKLFVDINGNHKGMNTNLLIQMTNSLAGSDLKIDPDKRAEWLADQISNDGRTFENLANRGGSLVGYVERYGVKPPVTLGGLKTAIRHTLGHGRAFSVRYGNNPDEMLEILDTYWKAVSDVFATSWGEPKKHILVQSIGLVAFSKLAGTLIDYSIQEDNLGYEFFRKKLTVVSQAISLERTSWLGIAGGRGATLVYEHCLRALIASGIEKSNLITPTATNARG